MKKIKYYLVLISMFILVTPVIVHADLEYVGCGNSEGIPKPLTQMTSMLYTILMIGVPLVLILFGVITMIKALKEGDADEVLKAKNKLIKKFAMAAIIILLMGITQFAMLRVTSNEGDRNSVISCLKCFMFQSDCHASSSGNGVNSNTVRRESPSSMGEDTTSNRTSAEQSNRNRTSNSNSSSTSNDSSGTPAQGGVCGSDKIYKGTTYSLTDAQKQKIAGMIMCEYSTDLNGMKAVASQMANLYEIKKYNNSSCTRSRSFYEYITAPVCNGCCGWYACYKASSTSNANALKAVEDVIVNGNRTLPLYIDEFDMYPGEVSPKLQPSEYVQGETVISGDYGGKGKFWCVTPSGNSGNLFYYTSDKYKEHVGG